jgi:serine phosphatase RsbU (regulator of sigma subunit)
MSMIANSLLNEIVYERKISNPAAMLNYLHEGVLLSLKQEREGSQTQDGMDIALCCIQRDKNLLHFAGAFRPLYIVRQGELMEKRGNRFPVGGKLSDEKRMFTHHELQIYKGDCLYLFSDGYADQFGGEKSKKFMLKNFQKLLLSVHHLPMNGQKKVIKETFETWKENVEQVDDVLVMGIRV